MAELLVAQVLWLLGQDEQLLRSRVGVMHVAIAAGALVDVIDSGAARWAPTDRQGKVETTGVSASDPLTRAWGTRLAEAAGSEPIPTIHAINALSPGTWDEVGAELERHGLATGVPRRVRRWLAPRHRPDRDAADRERDHLRKVIAGVDPACARDESVLAVASCAGVIEQVLSQTAFTDSAMLKPARTFLDGSELVQRLSPAVGYLVSMGPVLGINTNNS